MAGEQLLHMYGQVGRFPMIERATAKEHRRSHVELITTVLLTAFSLPIFLSLPFLYSCPPSS